MEFHFDRVQLGNTFDAHRVAQTARGTPAEGAVVKGLFGAYFTEGSLLSDHQTLQQTATAAGLAPDLVRGVLAGDAHTDDVRADESCAAGHQNVFHLFLVGPRSRPALSICGMLFVEAVRASMSGTNRARPCWVPRKEE